MAAARTMLLLVGCGTFLFILLLVGAGVVLYLMNRRWIARSIGPPAQALEILERWAADEGFEFLHANFPKDREHPFADRFGVGWGKRPAIVLRVMVRTAQREVRRGWAYLQFRGVRSRLLLSDTLEVAMDD